MIEESHYGGIQGWLWLEAASGQSSVSSQQYRLRDVAAVKETKRKGCWHPECECARLYFLLLAQVVSRLGLLTRPSRRDKVLTSLSSPESLAYAPLVVGLP